MLSGPLGHAPVTCWSPPRAGRVDGTPTYDAPGTGKTLQLVDDEVRRLIDTAHHDVTGLLTAHREQLDNLTAALLQAETLGGIDAYRAAGLPMHADSTREA